MLTGNPETIVCTIKAIGISVLIASPATGSAAWLFGKAEGWDSLTRWAHMLGFGGHFLTKARR